jgi:hypothetical protein
VNCLAVRELLPDHAVAALAPRERPSVERHLEWCAACRKECSELEEAAALLAFTASPAEPSASLEDRIVARVRRRSRKGDGLHGRLRLAVGAVAIAAVVAASGLGWGAVQARRANDAEAQASIQQQERLKEQAFQSLIDRGVPFTRPGDRALFALLDSDSGKGGHGWGFVMLSSQGKDVAGVRLVGLDPSNDALPYRVWAVFAQGRRLQVGKITSLDQAGAAQVVKKVGRDLGQATEFEVQDAGGSAVLSGHISSGRA